MFTDVELQAGSQWLVDDRLWVVAAVTPTESGYEVALADLRSRATGHATVPRADTRPLLSRCGFGTSHATVEWLDDDGWRGFASLLHRCVRVAQVPFFVLETTEHATSISARLGRLPWSDEARLSRLEAEAQSARRDGDFDTAARLLNGELPASRRELASRLDDTTGPRSMIELYVPRSATPRPGT